MKNQTGIIVLVLICLGLGIALIAIKKQAADQQHKDSEAILNLSNNWTRANNDLTEQKQVNSTLEKDVETQKKSLGELTNNLTQVSSNLAKTEADLKASQEEMAKRDAKIAELEAQNQALDRRAQDLSASITNLTQEIATTQKKLAASEGDKEFLAKELKRMVAEKSELERQFNDLAVLRAQVSKLKEEMVAKQRAEWAAQGVFANVGQKGAQRLMQLANPPPPAAQKTNYDLNVEVSADGSLKYLPPLTNRPEATTPPAPK
jgi:chromosome segregation ATPase